MDPLRPFTGTSPSIGEPASPVRPSPTADEGATGSFMGTLGDAINRINDLQLQASQAVDALATGQSQNLHQTMIALQQADVSFQLMMQIRNKLVSAYEEIQRMQV